MSLTEIVSVSAAAIALLGAGAGIIRDRRKPDLDEAQTASALVNSESVKATIKRMSDETNLARDQRIWALEQYVDQARPYMRVIRDVIDDLCHRLRVEVERNGGTMPDIVVPEPPPIPPPIALP